MDKKLIKKANEVIHIGNRLSLLERKLWNVLLWHAYPNLRSVQVHSFRKSELARLIGFRSNDTAVLKAALEKLVQTKIEWITISGTNEEWTVSAFLASAKLSRGVCEFAFSPHLRTLLYHPRFYTLFFLETQRKFSSYQSLALFENVARYRRVGSTGLVAVDDWRRLLGVDRIPSYGTFKEFNRMLKRAVAEINGFSDLHITPEYRREGRAVTAIRFRIRENPQPTLFCDSEAKRVEDDDLDQRFAEAIRSLSGEDLGGFEERFEKELLADSPMLRARFEKSAYESPVVQAAFREYVIEQLEEAPGKSRSRPGKRAAAR